MQATRLLHNLGPSIWLDNITRDRLDSGTLSRYSNELSVTGLTSNPTIFNQAIKNSSAYAAAVREKFTQEKSAEEVFFELALEDLTRAADLFLPIYDRANGVDGWVSLEVSPLLAYDAATTLATAARLHARAGRPNLLIKIPGTRAHGGDGSTHSKIRPTTCGLARNARHFRIHVSSWASICDRSLCEPAD